MIIIDSKEVALQPKVVEGFRKAKVPYRIMSLEVGDFTNDKETFIAERKGMGDFWNSMVDGRIDAQSTEMYEIYEKNRYMFIESGAFSYQSKLRNSTSWCYSKYGEIENWNVQIREYVDFVDLARKLDSLDKHLGKERVVRERRKKLKHMADNQKILARGIDGVGKKRAGQLLEECGTPMKVFEDIVYNGGERCGKIHGLKQGGAILNKIKKVLEEKCIT
jgi:ERCC4-type nuclease